MHDEQATLRMLRAPEYSEEERQRIIDYMMQLKGDQIREFLADRDLVQYGPKPQLRDRIVEYLDEGSLRYEDLVGYIDFVAPWGKQHVFLYDGPETEVERWRRETEATRLLREGRVLRLLNAKSPLGLPETLQVSSIEYKARVMLGVLAVERRDHCQRCEDKDRDDIIDGQHYELRAYANQVSRGLVIFHWNLVANTAELRISQLPSGSKYGEVEERFAKLVTPWLNLGSFSKLDLKRSIARLHYAEESGTPEARSHSISYRTTGGREVSASSPTQHDSVLGEAGVDNLLREIRESSVGRIANEYWLPASVYSEHNNPLQREIHTVIVAYRNRVNFTRPSSREEVEHVLSRVRALSR